MTVVQQNYMAVRLLQDRPLYEDDDEKRADALQFMDYAEVLAQAARETPGPFCIGIFGEWGEGKTSLMQMIKAQYSGDDSILPVWYNAWQFERDTDPMISLMLTVEQTLLKNQGFLGRSLNQIQNAHMATRALITGLTAKVKGGVPAVVEGELELDADKAIKRYEELICDQLAERSLTYGILQRLTKDLSNSISLSKKKIVIFIDDLDRCSPELGLALFDGLKLSLSLPGFICVVGLSRATFDAYLQYRYKQYGFTGGEFKAYIDKLIQLPFYLPKYESRMQKFIASLLSQLDNKEVRLEIERVIDLIEIVGGNNPRYTIRFINSILTDRAVISRRYKTSEHPFGAFVVARGLQSLWPEVYTLLIESSDCCKAALGLTEGVKPSITDMQNSNIEAIYKRTMQESRLQKLLYSESGKAWLGDENLRKATTEFLIHLGADSIIYNFYKIFGGLDLRPTVAAG